MSRGACAVLVLAAWIAGGILVSLLVFSRAAAGVPGPSPAPTWQPPQANTEWLAELNAVRVARGVAAVQPDARLGELLDEEGAGRITLTELLDRHGVICESGSWVVLSAPAAEPLTALLRARADSVINPSVTLGSVDRVAGRTSLPDAYRVLLCRPFS
jgi:hypothetical protein